MKAVLPNRGNFENMPENRRRDKEWSDKFIPEAKQLIIDYYDDLKYIIATKVSQDAFDSVMNAPSPKDIEVKTASFEDDVQKATDIYFEISYGGSSVIRIGFRVLKEKDYHTVTIRTKRESGVRTEYHKLTEDKPLQLYFFGWALPDDEVLFDWIIYDPIAFVDLGLAELALSRQKWGEVPPAKLETWFGWVKIAEVAPCIICSKKNLNFPVSLSLF